MGDLVLKGATSGQITLSPVGTAGTNTLTLPAKTGNIITSADTGTVTQTMLGTNVAGNGPAFSAYANTTQSITANVQTKVTLGTVLYDTNTNFSSSRFTPSVFGYYLITATVYVSASASQSYCQPIIFVGGTIWQWGTLFRPYGDLQSISTVTSLVRCSSASDYIELYVQADGTSPVVQGTVFSITSRMSGVLVRAL